MKWKFWQTQLPDECTHKWGQWVVLDISASKFTIVVKQARTCAICNFTAVSVKTRSS